MIFGLFDEWESNRKDSPYNCSPPSVSCPFSIEVANIEIMNCQKHKKIYGIIGPRDPNTRRGRSQQPVDSWISDWSVIDHEFEDEQGLF